MPKGIYPRSKSAFTLEPAPAPAPTPIAPMPPARPLQNRYPSENSVSREVQCYRRLIGELQTIHVLAGQLNNPHEPCHGTLQALRQRFEYTIELIEAILNEPEEQEAHEIES